MNRLDTFDRSENMDLFFKNLLDLKRDMKESLHEGVSTYEARDLLKDYYHRLDEIIKEES